MAGEMRVIYIFLIIVLAGFFVHVPSGYALPADHQGQDTTQLVQEPSNTRETGGLGTLLLIVLTAGGFIIAYNTYGRFLARKIFRLDADRLVPSREMNDGIDYVPTRKGIIFGHHFTSIAGTGPIVGPAIGIIWGWVPAVLWVVLGSIFMGAVHDLGSLVVSLRNQGRSISDIAGKYINNRVRFIFFTVVFLSLLIVIAIFGMVIAIVFAEFPRSVLPVWLQIPIAVMLGYAVYKRNAKVLVSTIIAVIGMYLTIWLGSRAPLEMPVILGIPTTGLWTIILLMYGWVASTLPVTMLLQPRDYINAWQLFVMMALLVVGAVVASAGSAMGIVAPAVNLHAAGAPPIWPFMFVTIACGAISGFHSLVASGTSPKQIAKETDAHFVGYGSMLLEGGLAVLILICVAAGIGIAYRTADGSVLSGAAAWRHHYSSWSGAAGLNANIRAVVVGAANMMQKLGLPEKISLTLMGVFIASFAGTTLDTSVRIQRYVIGELAVALKIPVIANRWTATTVAVVTAGVLAFTTGADGKGALTLWPLFGTANQLLAALAFLVITVYLRRKGGIKFMLTGVPCVIMLIITCWAMVLKEIEFITLHNWLLTCIGAGIFVLAGWMTVEAVFVFARTKSATGLKQV
ncbi:MAG: carbon starvation protein A [Planctomycetota bacterium]